MWHNFWIIKFWAPATKCRTEWTRSTERAAAVPRPLSAATRPSTFAGTATRASATAISCAPSKWETNEMMPNENNDAPLFLVPYSQNQLSGFLLRKFKNSNGWQKLWVVFTNFCLFFYKSHQDNFPLASLPLLGYAVSTPSDKDAINKDFVLKLQFKNHIYFFRAESDYTFGRRVPTCVTTICQIIIIFAFFSFPSS